MACGEEKTVPEAQHDCIFLTGSKQVPPGKEEWFEKWNSSSCAVAEF